MRRLFVAATALFLVIPPVAVAQEEGPDERGKPETMDDQFSYGIGLNLGRNIKEQGVELQVEFFVKGLQDGLSGAQPLLSDEEFRAAMTAYQEKLVAAQQERRSILAEANKKEGEAFLAANREREGVVTLESGLQYEVVQEGSGAIPKATDRVTVDYRGTLVDGTVFDSSYDRGEPITLPVTGIIDGWSEALQLMKTGSHWKLFIPPELAYGEQGAGAAIGPSATLIFDVELLAIAGEQ